MKKCNSTFVICISLFFSFLVSCSAQTRAKDSLTWTSIYEGVDYCETDGPFKSVVNDSKISILKLNPEKFDFYLLSATEFDNKPRTVVEWADTFDLNIVINAGMYNLSKTLLSKGYLKNYDHVNNPEVHPTYNAVIAFNPKDSLNSKFIIHDLTCSPWDSVKSDYNCYAQGMRMIDCNGKALSWNKKNQSCSMLVAAIDEQGNIYYIFTRSPYSHNEIIQFILSLPFHLKETIYMEGGPETSLYVNIGNTKIEKVGSYISNSYPNDKNDHFWKLPNVIGVKVKK
jgi:hypothetical protein